MRSFAILFATIVAGIALSAAGSNAKAQVSVEIGAPPDCPYGYYDVAPYACAPAGYYGPEWFVDGVFIGAGPWFHGPANFHGRVNNHFHPAHGYKGPMPARGEKPVAANRVDEAHFHGNESRDGKGHTVKGKH